MSLPFFTGQVPTAADFNALAVSATLAGSGGAALIGYGGTTVKLALDGITTGVTSVNGHSGPGAVTITAADISGVALLNGDITQNFNVKDATGSHHAISLSQADARYAAIGSGGTGTVTSVGLALPADYTISNSPVTASGVLTAVRANQTANKFLASPSGSSGAPVYRAIVGADIPILNQSTTGTAANVSGVVAFANGGTGQAGRQIGLNALTNAGTAIDGQVLTRVSGDAVWSNSASGGNFLQAGTGAVTRTMQNKVRESVSVLDFGATGDGVTDDTAACQAAITSLSTTGGAVYFPTGNYKITSSLTLPAVHLTLHGDGPASRLFSAGTMITYPTSVYDSHANLALQNIYDLFFEQTGNGNTIRMIQTWDSLGKAGPVISGCYFFHSSASTTSAVAILMTGIWSAKIDNCWFVGRGAGGGPTTGIGGFAIRMTVGAGTSTNVMNVIISNNTILTIAFPIYMDMRNPSGGGVVEGVKIIGNNLAAGYNGITTRWSLATTITGCQISDYFKGIESVSDFDMAVTGNAEINGSNSSINLISGPVGYGATERISIVGNNLYGGSGVGLRLSNGTANDQLRAVSITGNNFKGVEGSPAGTGISLEGSNTINGCSFISNTFSDLAAGFFFSGVGHTLNQLGLNTFSHCTGEFTNFSSSGTYGNPLLAATVPKAFVQVGADLSSTAPIITFPVAFKAGTVPAVFISVAGTANTTMEAPAISIINNTTLEIQKKQYNGAAIVLTNYQIFWMAIGEAG